MKLCRNCNHVSPDEAQYCGKCRSTFGAKLCPKGHRNPVGLKYCQTCGSKELSQPHPLPSGPPSYVPVLMILAALFCAVAIGYFCNWLSIALPRTPSLLIAIVLTSIFILTRFMRPRR